MREFKFKIGDHINVVAVGSTYDMYGTFVQKTMPSALRRFHSGRMPETNRTYNVIMSARHPRLPVNLYIIEENDTSDIFIISEGGLEIAKA